MDKTIIYYTSNQEGSLFEEKIRENILKHKGNLPIISVSQKPMGFGKNICVGDVGHSYLNEFRQILQKLLILLILFLPKLIFCIHQIILNSNPKEIICIGTTIFGFFSKIRGYIPIVERTTQ